MRKCKRRFFSILLVLTMVLSMATTVSAEIPRSSEGYYALTNREFGETYISQIKFVNETLDRFGDHDDEAKEILQVGLNSQGGYLDKDLNDGAGGNYIFVGWDGTNNPNEAITGLRIVRTADVGAGWVDSYEVDGVVWKVAKLQVVKYSNMKYGIEENYVNLNSRCRKGDYMLLYYTTDLSFGPPIQAIKFTEDDTTKLDKHHDPVLRMWSDEWYDVNENAGGDYIYLYTMSGFEAVEVARLRELLTEAEHYLAEPEAYDNIDELLLVYNEAKTISDEWGDVKYYTGDVDMVTKVPYYVDRLETAINALYAKITFDGETNGGSYNYVAKYSLDTHLYNKETKLFTVNLDGKIIEKEDSDFLGWSLDPNAASGQKSGDIEVKAGTILYAIYGENRGSSVGGPGEGAPDEGGNDAGGDNESSTNTPNEDSNTPNEDSNTPNKDSNVTGNKDVPKTNDVLGMNLYLAVAVVSGIVALAAWKKRRLY